jgi:hypothetical protein
MTSYSPRKSMRKSPKSVPAVSLTPRDRILLLQGDNESHWETEFFYNIFLKVGSRGLIETAGSDPAVSLKPRDPIPRSHWKKALARESGPYGGLFDGKNRESKISWHCPFNTTLFVYETELYLLNIPLLQFPVLEIVYIQKPKTLSVEVCSTELETCTVLRLYFIPTAPCTKLRIRIPQLYSYTFWSDPNKKLFITNTEIHQQYSSISGSRPLESLYILYCITFLLFFYFQFFIFNWLFFRCWFTNNRPVLDAQNKTR